MRHLVFWRKSWAGFRQKVFHRSQRDRQITCMPRWVNIIATSLICETSFRRTFFSFRTSSILMNLLQREMSKWQINLSKNKIRSIHVLFMWAPRSLSPNVYIAACLKQFTVTSTCEILPPCTHAPITLKFSDVGQLVSESLSRLTARLSQVRLHHLHKKREKILS